MFAVYLQVAGLTGLRRGELCALRWSDVGWTDNVLRVERSVYETAGGGWAEKKTKNHQAVTLPVATQTTAVLGLHRNTVEVSIDRILAHPLSSSDPQNQARRHKAVKGKLCPNRCMIGLQKS